MLLDLTHIKNNVCGSIQLTASKSESNRALIIQALASEHIEIQNLADAEDTRVLNELIQGFEPDGSATLNVGLAGTAMRFLTAVLAITPGNWILTGDDRMKQRPIELLVNALDELGATIDYKEEEGYPPLAIAGRELKGGEIVIEGGVSSQYISALLMIAPKLEGGLQLKFNGIITSKPYIQMTLNMMQHFGIVAKWQGNEIDVKQGAYEAKIFEVEADWSAASYYYGIVALANQANIQLMGLKEQTLQGDAEVAQIYRQLGVSTTFINGGVQLSKIEDEELPAYLELDFRTCPDIAQTVAVSCAALNIEAKLTGLKTLRIKETDRISALQTELNQLGFKVEVESDDLMIKSAGQVDLKKVAIKTYNDHRMGMAFAPLALIGEISIEHPEVVKKSYPNFWEDLELLV